MTGLDQTATTCQGAETPDPFTVSEAHASHATPCMTSAPISHEESRRLHWAEGVRLVSSVLVGG
jgi:hypothetical protein